MKSRQEKKARSGSSTSNKSKKELPRKAAKIRRTHPEPGVEKTELRFIMYCKPGGQYKREKFLGEVADFFQEQAKRLADEQGHLPAQQLLDRQPESVPLPKPKATVCSTECPLRKADPEPGVVLVKDLLVKEHHHEQHCPRARAIRTSLPVIRKLIDKIQELKDGGGRKNKEIVAILKTAEGVYEDAEKCLASGGYVGDHIADRIARLNQIANEVLAGGGKEKGPSPRAPVYSSSSVSNVNAVSHVDSSLKVPRRRH